MFFKSHFGAITFFLLITLFPNSLLGQNSFEESLIEEPPRLDIFRGSIQIGYGYRTAKISSGVPPELRSYITKLKTGATLSADAGAYLGKKMGLGVKYMRWATSNSKASVSFVESATGNPVTGPIEDNITVSFFGPVLIERKTWTKARMVSNVGIGLVSYQNESKVLNIPIPIEATTIGLTGQIGMDFMVNQQVALGFSLGLLISSTDRFRIGGQTVNAPEAESFSRFDFNVNAAFWR